LRRFFDLGAEKRAMGLVVKKEKKQGATLQESVISDVTDSAVFGREKGGDRWGEGGGPIPREKWQSVAEGTRKRGGGH